MQPDDQNPQDDGGNMPMPTNGSDDQGSMDTPAPAMPAGDDPIRWWYKRASRRYEQAR